MLKEIDYTSREEWLIACLREGFCPVCETRGDCDHMIANIDLTYGSVDAGSLQSDVERAISKNLEDGETQRDAVLWEVEYLKKKADFYVSSEFFGDRPGGDSEDFWFWAKDVKAVRKEFT